MTVVDAASLAQLRGSLRGCRGVMWTHSGSRADASANWWLWSPRISRYPDGAVERAMCVLAMPDGTVHHDVVAQEVAQCRWVEGRITTAARRTCGASSPTSWVTSTPGHW